MPRPDEIKCIVTRDGWAAGGWRRAGDTVTLRARDAAYEPLLKPAPTRKRKRKAAQKPAGGEAG